MEIEITGAMVHEAFTLASGSGKRWEDISDEAKDRYNAMARILATIIDRDLLIAEYTRDWRRDNPWMSDEQAHNLAQAGYEQRIREAQGTLF